MEEKIKLSIIIPIYNVENYLEECLSSIYEVALNKEVILVNDGSTDNSYKIIEKYAEKYPEITKVINQENRGLSGARNSGLRIAEGEYISFIDSDDYIRPKEFEEFFILGKNEKLDIIIGDFIRLKEDKYMEFERKEQLEKLGVVTGKEFFRNSFKMEVWDDIYKRELLINNNIYFEEGILHEDALFTPLVLNKARRVKYFPIPFYIYRQREGSIMSTLNPKKVEDKKYIILKLLEKRAKNDLNLYLTRYIISILLNIKNEKGDLSYSYLFNILKYVRIRDFVNKNFYNDCKRKLKKIIYK